MANAKIIQGLAESERLSDAAGCLAPLLDSLMFRGTSRQIAEAATTSWTYMDSSDVRNTMANLGFRSSAQQLRLGDLDTRLLPCLFESRAGDKLVIWNDPERGVLAYDARSHSVITDFRDRAKGMAYFFSYEASEDVKPPRSGWFRPIARRFESLGIRILALSFLLSILALAVPIYIKAIFDQVIGTKSLNTLSYLIIGVLLALAFGAILRFMRSQLFSHIGGRLDIIVNNAVIDKLMDLPLSKLEKAPVGTQLARLREFEGIRGFFAGPMAIAFVDLPFVIIFIVAIAIIGGWLAIVPVVLVAILGLGATIAIRYSKAAVADSIKGDADCQSTLVEILENMRFIKDEGTEELWLERYRERSSSLALSNLSGARINARFQNFSQVVMMVAGAATLTLGAMFAANGQFTAGALIACMALVWRVLSPLQALFQAFTKLSEVKNSITRINQLMSQTSETSTRTSGETIARDREFEGRISFNRVTMRYATSYEPVLAGLTFDANPGELVAIIGANGSGKSTIMKLIANLYKPQSGMVSIDGSDTRQLNLLDLRNSIAYLPQSVTLFAGSIEENLRVANPVASRAEIEDVCRQAGVLDDVENLANGLDTILTDQTMKQVSTGFAKGLTLARTFLCKSNIMLLDEPSVGLDKESDDMLKKYIAGLRGKVTTIYVTHRSDYIKLADRVIALREGKVVFNGTPKELAAIGKGE